MLQVAVDTTAEVEGTLSLKGFVHKYTILDEDEKEGMLVNLLDTLEFTQVGG